MNLLSKLVLSSRRKERHEQLKHGDRILVEFGRDRVPMYINMYEIPPSAKTLVDTMARSALKRRVKLPDVAKFMYDDYIAWVDTVETTAGQKSWGHVILMAYTTKVLQDASTHDKALLAMMTKGEAVDYQKDLMFSTGDWDMLHIHVKAGDTRDEGMRQVLQRLFNRSVGLWELLNISTRDIIDMGLDREKIFGVANSLTDGSMTAVSVEEQAHDASIHNGDHDDVSDEEECSSVSDIDETDSATAASPSNSKEDNHPDQELPIIDKLNLSNEKVQTGKTKADAAASLPRQQEKNRLTYTEAEMKAALKKLPTDLKASKWAPSAGKHDTEKVISTKGYSSASLEAERIAVFTPKKQLPRLPSDLQLPVYTRNVYTKSPNDQDNDYASGFSPRYEIPRSVITSPMDHTFRGEGNTTTTKTPTVLQSGVQGRKIANLKYSKSVLNTQRAKQAVWPGDAPSNSGATYGTSSSTHRQPKGPPFAGDWKELKDVAGNQALVSQNFAGRALPKASEPTKKRKMYSFEKGFHDVDA